jgi:hypothetical protein
VGGVVDILVGQVKGNDLAAGGVDADVQLAPSASLRRAVFFKQPFTRAAQFQSGAIDDQVKVASPVSPVRIPKQSGRGFRFDVGHRSDLIPAAIPK